jgi:hypothetical protein
MPPLGLKNKFAFQHCEIKLEATATPQSEVMITCVHPHNPGLFGPALVVAELSSRSYETM